MGPKFEVYTKFRRFAHLFHGMHVASYDWSLFFVHRVVTRRRKPLVVGAYMGIIQRKICNMGAFPPSLSLPLSRRMG